MNNNSQLNNLGDQMKGALNDALTTGNFENLKSLVSDTVNFALNEAGATASKAWQQQQGKDAGQSQKSQQQGTRQSQTWQQQSQETSRSWQQQHFERHSQQTWRMQQTWQREQEWKQQREQQEQEHERKIQERERQLERQRELARRQEQERRQLQQIQKSGLPVAVKNKGSVAGVLLIVFGAIANIPLFILALIGVLNGWGATGVLVIFLLISIFAICHGKNKLQLVEKAKRYVKLCGTKMYAEVEELAAQVGVSPRKVERELRRILQKGLIPTAHMDKKGTHLMLNEVVYKQYQDAEKARLVREKEEKERAKEKLIEKKQAKNRAAKSEEHISEVETQPKTELEQMIEEGQECIGKLRYMNDLIPGEAISNKLYQLENILEEIFQRLSKEPAQMNRMHKVMNYYLPTTLKLVEAYHEFDVVSNPNEEILSAKKEIESTLDTINEAFVELLNSLFQDRVMDVTTDAQVLQTMLANEGLTREMDLTKAGN